MVKETLNSFIQLWIFSFYTCFESKPKITILILNITKYKSSYIERRGNVEAPTFLIFLYYVLISLFIPFFAFILLSLKWNTLFSLLFKLKLEFVIATHPFYLACQCTISKRGFSKQLWEVLGVIGIFMNLIKLF